MTHEVIIDGIKYVPDITIRPTDDATVLAALHELVSLHYFENWHKAPGITGLVIEMLSPELWRIMDGDIAAAFERTSKPD